MKVVIANDTSGECHTGCNAVMRSYEQLCEKHDMRIIQRLTRKDIIKGGAAPAFAADLLIINGEGTLHHNTPNTRFFSLLLERTRCPAVLVNAVWDSVGFLTPQLIGMMNDKLKLIATRETASKRQIIKPYEGAVYVVPDLCFAQPIRKLKQTRQGRGYSDCVVSKHTRQWRKHPNYRPLIRKPKPYSWDEYTGWLQGLQLYTTGRFHGLCMAIMTDTPRKVLSSNCHKNEALMADLTLYESDAAYVTDARAKINKLWERLKCVSI